MTRTARPVDNTVFAFGRFRLYPAERLLLREDKPVRVGSRGFEILVTLVERAGETVLKGQLTDRVWPDMVVDEAGLRVHVAGLRKALGDGRDGDRFIGTIPGRGYSFVAPVTRAQQQATALPSQHARVGNLPAQLTRVIGRSGVITTAVSRLSQHRLLTITGPGGIGKTTVAVAVSEAMSASYPDGVWFVGLSAIIDAALVPGAVAATLGVSPSYIEPLTALVAWLRDKRLLIVLDCCEHVVNAAAALAEAVLRAAPGVCILATSREPLRAQGEWLLRLPSLEVPSGAALLSANEALGYSAVELFNERATATAEGFALSDNDVPDALEICRRLDGMPLALELAATKVDVFGIKGLVAALEDRLAVLTRGRRTALPRHQTLRATIDWSYDLLPPAEQVVLRRAAVFTGDFAMRAAELVCGGNGLTGADVFVAVTNLGAKSLIAADISGETASYRLLDTTRAYAFDKLAASGELGRVHRQMADVLREEFPAVAAAEPELIAHHLTQAGLDEPAIEWWGKAGDQALRRSAFKEATAHLGKAIELADNLAATSPSAVPASRRLRLQTNLGIALLWAKGHHAPATSAAFARARELASREEEASERFSADYGLWIGHLARCEPAPMREIAELFLREALAGPDCPEALVAHRISGTTCFYFGDFAGAHNDYQKSIELYDQARHGDFTNRFGDDLRAQVEAYDALALWGLGRVDEALRLAERAVSDAESAAHAPTMCNVFFFAAKLGFLRYDPETVATYGGALADIVSRYDLPVFWAALAVFIQGWAKSSNGAEESRFAEMRRGLAIYREQGRGWLLPSLEAALAEAEASAGETDGGLRRLDDALAELARTEQRWYEAEMHRIRAEILLKRDPADTAAAEQSLQAAIAIAQHQQARSFELRAALALAKLYRAANRGADAHAVLAPAVEGFPPTRQFPELTQAQALL
jgi:predicted ATPase/DNA-binding winged helix-turn-helix (wHTH) protein